MKPLGLGGVVDALEKGLGTVQIARQDPVALVVNPGLELVRFVVPKGGVGAERNWRQRWQEARATLGPEDQAGCTPGTGRMAALVNHPIWQALGDGAGGYRDTLGNAWEPFAFNSGMGRIAVSRRDCLALGILRPDQRIEPDRSIDINEGLEASASKFDAALQDQLAKTPGLRLLDGVLTLIENDGRRRLVGRLEQWREAYLNANANHDSLGRFAPTGGALSERDNIRRGSRAIERALRTKRDVRDAMMVKGLGTVHFKWGRSGNPRPDETGRTHVGGSGLAKILHKRGPEAVRAIPLVLAKGRQMPQGEFSDRRLIKWKNWSAVVVRQNKTNSWVLSNIDDDVPIKKLGRLPEGQSALDEVGNRVGTPCPTRRPLLDASESAVASNIPTFAQTRSRLKQLLREAA